MNYKRKSCRHRLANGKFVYPDVWGFKKSFLKDYLDKRNFNKVIHRKLDICRWSLKEITV
jgi:hypothetical protein